MVMWQKLFILTDSLTDENWEHFILFTSARLDVYLENATMDFI